MIVFILLLVAALAIPVFAERHVSPDRSLAIALERRAQSTFDGLVGMWHASVAVVRTSVTFAALAFLVWLLYSIASKLFF